MWLNTNTTRKSWRSWEKNLKYWFFLPALKRSEFFALIKKKGILPRKSFSLGKENEKRYYIEARRIMQ
jgi:hypothetical protein